MVATNHVWLLSSSNVANPQTEMLKSVKYPQISKTMEK